MVMDEISRVNAQNSELKSRLKEAEVQSSQVVQVLREESKKLERDLEEKLETLKTVRAEATTSKRELTHRLEETVAELKGKSILICPCFQAYEQIL